MFDTLQEKIEFRDNYIYKREEEIMKIIQKFKIQDAYFLSQNACLSIDLILNKQMKEGKMSIFIEEIKKLSFIDNVIKTKKCLLIYYSGDVRSKIHEFFNY